jgi:hypothetical protein
MLTADFPDRDELKTQTNCAEVCWECDCGCGTINMELKEPYIRAAARGSIPVEAYGKDVDVLLFVKEGPIRSLEIVDHGDAPHSRIPAPTICSCGFPRTGRLEARRRRIQAS